MEYVKLDQIVTKMNIKRGDKVFVSSDVTELLKCCMQHGDITDLNVFIDSLMDMVGEEGTLIFPTYNWGFCSGKDFDYQKTKSKTGILSQKALERPEFKRTKRPIYSFAVWGKDQEYLCSLDNISSFGSDSPFAFFHKQNVKNLVIGVGLENCFTFSHYVEEMNSQIVSYRYMKNFYGNYVDEEGRKSKRTYSMLVRSLSKKTSSGDENMAKCRLEEMLKEMLKENVAEVSRINGVRVVCIELGKAYPLLENDIRQNRGRKLVNYYEGQESELTPKDEMWMLMNELFPICRSITGNGFRNSLYILKSILPEIQMFEVPTGTRVFDWTVPKEWNISEAYIENEAGDKILDFKDNNLQVVGYSLPMDEWMSAEELKQICYIQEDQPDVVPYVTSYYKERSGFCMTKKVRDSLHGRYHAVIDSALEDGSLTYGEAYFRGESEKEILISTYLCHPSMANNECSGPAVATMLADYVKKMKNRKYSYRFVFIPETIGSLTYLSQNLKEKHMKENVIAGFVLSCVGDERTYSIVESRKADTLTDRVLHNVLHFYYPEYKRYSYLERGSDERQYNAPGIDLPVCAVCRSKYGEYPEYHTSKDDLTLVTPEGLMGSYELMKLCFQALEHNVYYQVTCMGEPQLGKRGLYPTVSQKGTYDHVKSMMNFLAYADGEKDLIEISNKIEVPIHALIPIIEELMKHKLLIEKKTI